MKTNKEASLDRLTRASSRDGALLFKKKTTLGISKPAQPGARVVSVHRSSQSTFFKVLENKDSLCEHPDPGGGQKF